MGEVGFCLLRARLNAGALPPAGLQQNCSSLVYHLSLPPLSLSGACSLMKDFRTNKT